MSPWRAEVIGKSCEPPGKKYWGPGGVGELSEVLNLGGGFDFKCKLACRTEMRIKFARENPTRKYGVWAPGEEVSCGSIGGGAVVIGFPVLSQGVN